ncbi:endonuclease/exonuclease/phosphatase family protein [Plesiocystis pacifica]|uniref:endonuclease/exonuclease/phosphatase family protein n=1 Tax=Plesiocystis pacifica TaxID=191768 RepID=UPI0012F72D10|nr:endonuclease/exonuclease/phosphatase family protein [Plesiocystis pacifica]
MPSEPSKPSSSGGRSRRRRAAARLARALTQARGERSLPATIERHGPEPEPAPTPEALTLVSANLAHGRGVGAHQLLTKPETLRANLRGIAAWIAEANADLACVQEADASSWWSGRFDHVAFLAQHSGLPYVTRACNVDGGGLRYGTALLSRWPLEQAWAHTFAPTPPTFRKGFVISSLRWPGAPELEFDVVSVHTDFARASQRRRQVRELAALIRQRGRPVIVAGDLNSDWREGGATRLLARDLELEAFEPTGPMVTFPGPGPSPDRRLDWVLISKAFEFSGVEAVDLRLSDHRPLLARVRLRGA